MDGKGLAPPISAQVDSVLASLKELSTKATRDGLARYGIPSDKAFGVKAADIQKLAKQVGRNHELAEGLWKTGWLEARMMTAYLDEPERVTAQQMERWSRDFDNWAIVDTLCFCLFDKTPHAFGKIKVWSRSKDEFVKRAAFALLWGVSLHDKKTGDGPFLDSLKLIEREATDERNFVKKAVVMALRAVGGRSQALHDAAVELAQRLARSEHATARWVGKNSLRKLTSGASKRRLGRT
jgi:3-methyladenine DNA glycosylase AlkD